MDYERSTYFPFGFALSRHAWDRYGVRELAPRPERRGAAIDSRGVRRLAQRINEDRSAHAPSAPPIGGAQLLTLGIVNEALRFLFDYYCTRQVPGALRSAFDWVRSHDGEPTVTLPPPAFVDLYPPQKVMDGEPLSTYLSRPDDGRPVSEITAREMVLLNLAMTNPAMQPFTMLFRDEDLRARAPYVHLVVGIESYLSTTPPLDLIGEPLFECLRAPMRAAPHSLEAQLEFIRTQWAHILPKELVELIQTVQGILTEEYKQRGGFVPGGMVEVLRFGARDAADTYPEWERFSPDADWMSNVVLIAKTVYVWLDQLSKKHGRHIHRLDQIPDEELDQLARWGFNGLWLIGLWERSEASATIKRIMGNPDAVSSAYSLYDYQIASDLGGEDAYANLRERARQRGIRLASDMVPNHMGIFSRWVIEHPHWFISLPYPPYPNYSFTGPNLSHDPRVGLYIEDGYWTHRDAAVVFKRVDHHTGDTRYIYHGNDGTSMPWNDTAQLNYLMPEVREAVIQTILHVARKFPIIRFDAAMTLAKKHFQRLWYPKPGDAGAIPSRAEHGMSRDDFDRAMPEEFWREVVDRVAREVPDTLLLAEAFWLMEGYFVRTLGMHRVYNSAFMNMLKMEQNANYRTTVKNVLEFSPEILKRFVNFMNNPDERTAVEQFGKSDKYFGVCLMMATMPGLPMFGHGQIEGFTEKYGMEYRRAYWDEHVDEDLVRRHEREIFPLLRRRYLFSGVEHFAFYDFHTNHGWVDENVFAYSNRAGDQRSLVLYNNAYNTTSGWIRISTGLNTGRGDEGKIITKSLAQSLGLRCEDDVYYAFRDHRDGLEYIRHSRQLADQGMFVHLYGYQWHVFIDWREVVDADGSWGELAWSLDGRGVPSLEYERRERLLQPLIVAFRDYFSPQTILSLDNALDERFRRFTRELGAFTAIVTPSETTVRSMPRVPRPETESPPDTANAPAARDIARRAYALLKPVLLSLSEPPTPIDAALDELHLTASTISALEAAHQHPELAHDTWRRVRLVLRALLSNQSREISLTRLVLEALDDTDVQEYLAFNRHQDVLYLNQERFERYIETLSDCFELEQTDSSPAAGTSVSSPPHSVGRESAAVAAAAKAAGFRVESLRSGLAIAAADHKKQTVP